MESARKSLVPALDWAVAANSARALIQPGPDLSAAEVAAVVAELRGAAARAIEPIAEVSELSPPGAVPVLVIDRGTWVEAVCESAQAMLGEADAEAATPLERLRAKSLGAQAGAAFAILGSRILGQFDPFVSTPRLLLVAPNVVTIERQLAVSPEDFRLWVCLHEQTHSFQFANAPWLKDQLLALFSKLIEGEAAPFSWPTGGRPAAIRDLIGDPEQQEAFDQITAVMSLMEGHAEVMMDRVGVGVVPTLPRIRKAFEAHRDATGWGSWLRRLIGLDLKRNQYRDGAEFCRQVIGAAGVSTLNLAFSKPSALPNLTEIHEPQLWLHRL